MYTPKAPVTVSAVPDERAEVVRTQIREAYDIELVDVTQFDEETASSDVYLTTTEDGEKFVVKYSYWYDGGAGSNRDHPLETAYEVSEALRVRGVSLPRVYKNQSGTYTSRCDSGRIAVLSYLEGAHFSPSEESFYASGSGLGVFNREGVVVLHNTELRARMEKDLQVEKSYADSRKLYNNGLREELLEEHTCTFPDVCKAFREEIDLIDQMITLVDESGVLNKAQSSGILHFDFHVNNGLYTDGGTLTGFLDIDQMTIGPHIWDVGNSLVSFISNAHNLNPQCDVEVLTKAFFRGYHEENPLSTEEYVRTIPAGIMFDVLRTLRSLRRHRFEDDRFSHLYGSIPTRMIPRFKELPKLFTFLTPTWIEREVLG